LSILQLSILQTVGNKHIANLCKSETQGWLWCQGLEQQQLAEEEEEEEEEEGDRRRTTSRRERVTAT
jgi:hypothetical protein